MLPGKPRLCCTEGEVVYNSSKCSNGLDTVLYIVEYLCGTFLPVY